VWRDIFAKPGLWLRLPMQNRQKKRFELVLEINGLKLTSLIPYMLFSAPLFLFIFAIAVFVCFELTGSCWW